MNFIDINTTILNHISWLDPGFCKRGCCQYERGGCQHKMGAVLKEEELIVPKILYISNLRWGGVATPRTLPLDLVLLQVTNLSLYILSSRALSDWTISSPTHPIIVYSLLM